MKVTVKVFPTLKHYLRPEWADQTEFNISLKDLPGKTKSVGDLIAFLQLPAKEVGQIIINGHIKWDKGIELHAGDRIVLSIYVGGG
jgi:hypothetical protein